MPAARHQLAKDEFKQRALARAVGPDDADPVAAHDARGKIADDEVLTVAETDPSQIDDQFPRCLSGIDGKVRPALHRDPLRMFLPQRLQRPDPTFVARAPGLDAPANPRFFFGEFLVELRHGADLDIEKLVLLVQVAVEIAGKGDEPAAVELDNAGGQVS